MEQIESLIGKIKKCNLSKEDKLALCGLLQTQLENKKRNRKVNFTKFIKRFLLIFSIGKEGLDCLDIDILKFIKKLLE